MSLDPPPCELFTIVLPFLSATLVNPPVLTYVVFPLSTNGLKSRCLGSISFSVIVGAVERVSRGCAIYSLGFFLILAITSSLSYLSAVGPIIIP